MPQITNKQKARLKHRAPQAKPVKKANGFLPRFSVDCFNSQPEKHTLKHTKLNHLGIKTANFKG